jgi:hypothetical protein
MQAIQGPYHRVDHPDSWTIQGPKHECVAQMYGNSNVATANILAASFEAIDALDPEILEAIADEIDCFEHSARSSSLRILAKRQRAVIAKAHGENG